MSKNCPSSSFRSVVEGQEKVATSLTLGDVISTLLVSLVIVSFFLKEGLA
jgi:hypothetical protein